MQQAEEKQLKKSQERLGKLHELLTYREYIRSDYDTAKEWWVKHNAAHLEKHFLPTTGIVISAGTEPVAMGWLFFSNSLCCQLGWVVTKPDIGPKMRFCAVVHLIEVAKLLAEDGGFKIVQMFSDSSGLTGMAKKAGFKAIHQHDFLVTFVGETLADDI